MKIDYGRSRLKLIGPGKIHDSFGNILSQSNSADAMRLAYTGQQYDSQTGLYYDHARYYDPTTGRFLSTDPAGFTAGDANLYRYVGNSPLDRTDPTGLCADSSTGQGDDSGPITPDRAYREYQQALADLNIANGTASADDFRTRRDELMSEGLTQDQADSVIAPLVSEASAQANEENAIRQQEIQNEDQWNQTEGIAYGYFWLAPKALVVGTATAIYNEVTDPIGTTERQIDALIHPVNTVETTWNAIQQAWQTPEGKGQILGTIALGWATGQELTSGAEVAAAQDAAAVKSIATLEESVSAATKVETSFAETSSDQATNWLNAQAQARKILDAQYAEYDGVDALASHMTSDQQALKELVDDVTLVGRKPLSLPDANTVLDWAEETGYPGVRVGPGDLAIPSNWKANPVPHIHIPGTGRGGHVPVEPGLTLR